MTPLVFVVLALLYVGTMAPALAPYRDTGEMAAAAATLSVAHPTSYPSYILLGKLANLLPLGNAAYRLNLLSALCAALCCALVFREGRRRAGMFAGLTAAVILALNPAFWGVAQVQEMYSLGLLAAAGLFLMARRQAETYSPRLWRTFCFCSGLALTNRLDLLLWAPGLIWLALSEKEEKSVSLWASLCLLAVPAAQCLLSANWPILLLVAGTAVWRCPDPRRARWAAVSAACAAAGFSLYLYLPVRSAGGPWLDWNHPAAASNFLESLLRSRYGGTLDLLSKNYKAGELFGDGLLLYGKHLWRSFWIPGLALAAAGAFAAARARPRQFLGELACWWWSGPVFILLANMPSNPHAAAVVEPHYLLSDLVLAFWAAEGAGLLGKAAPLAPAAVLLFPFLDGRLRDFQRREHLHSYDFAKTVFRSTPKGGVVVAKKDVPLYALWSYQMLQGWRPDVRPVAQGLAGSPWYQKGWAKRDGSLRLTAVRDGHGWKRLSGWNGAVYATPDCEIPADVMGEGKPRGLLHGLGEAQALDERFWELDWARGEQDYDAQPDFFTSDLVSERAQALYRLGAGLALSGQAERGKPLLRRAWAMQFDFPEPAVMLAYLAYGEGKLREADELYGQAAGILRELLGRAADYRALPDVVAGLRRSYAEVLMHRGVVAEKLGRREEALKLYETSLAWTPLAQAHYNLAVYFWGRDAARVRAELDAALRLQPGHPEAAAALRKLR